MQAVFCEYPSKNLFPFCKHCIVFWKDLSLFPDDTAKVEEKGKEAPESNPGAGNVLVKKAGNSRPEEKKIPGDQSGYRQVVNDKSGQKEER